MEDLLRLSAERTIRYLAGLNQRGVAPTAAALDRLAELGGPLPEAPADPAEVLALLDRVGSPAATASAGGRYFGFVTGGALPAALAANWLAGAWDQNSFMIASSPLAAAFEEITQRWLLDVLALPPESGVGFVTGATMANLSALAAARHALLDRLGWDVEAQGLFGAPPITVIVGEEVHVSLLKALGLLGLGRGRVVRVPTDVQGRMRADALPAITGPTIVCLQAGNVNTGACDPAEAICARAHDAGAWVHVDGAFGLWYAAAPGRAHLAQGLAAADSWATDGHKWLNVPYDSGLVICRHPEQLRAAMSVQAAYLGQPGERGEPFQYTPEMSRRARGIEIWAALRSLGRAGLADLIERCCRHAARVAEGLRAGGYQVHNQVVGNQVLVSFGDADATRRVVTATQDDGTCWCGGSVWQGQVAMRISVSSWATTEDDIERSLAAMLRIASDNVKG
jgi:glutamate/tyrosine decarboxylase-like PLP-dependent enzyme